ncbi:MAG: hypothetical protein ACE5FK_00430 [Candidatus Methylomirabilia bacterium]
MYRFGSSVLTVALIGLAPPTPAWAQIDVVLSDAPVWSEGASWTLSERPRLVIGGRGDEDEADALYRVEDAVRLPDGKIAIANRGTQEIRVFAEDGQLESTFGRLGQGPGEFEWLGGLDTCGDPDELTAFDQVNHRLTVFNWRTGQVLHTNTVRAPAGTTGIPYDHRCHGSSEVLVATRGVADAVSYGLYEVPVVVSLWDPVGGDHRVLDVRGSYARHRFETSDGPALFGRKALVAVGRTRVFVAPGSAGYEIVAFAKSGERLHTIRLARSLRPLTAAVIDRELEWQLMQIPESEERRRARLRSQWGQIEFPTSLPQFEDAIVDAQGNLWVGDFTLHWEAVREWQVFDPDGHWLGTVPMSRSLKPFEIGSDYLLGRVIDDWGVETVVLHELIKP